MVKKAYSAGLKLNLSQIRSIHKRFLNIYLSEVFICLWLLYIWFLQHISTLCKYLLLKYEVNKTTPYLHNFFNWSRPMARRHCRGHRSTICPASPNNQDVFKLQQLWMDRCSLMKFHYESICRVRWGQCLFISDLCCPLNWLSFAQTEITRL